ERARDLALVRHRPARRPPDQNFAPGRAPGEAFGMNKQDLIAQLSDQLAASARAALGARDAAAIEAREGATPDEKREDARAAHQLQTLGGAQQKRAQRALAEVDALATFRPAPQMST